MIHSRLDPTERSEVRSGSVFIWEERSSSSVAGYGAAPGGESSILYDKIHFVDWPAMYADIGSSGNVRGIERWTDGLKWGPSRVRDVSHSLSACLSDDFALSAVIDGLLGFSLPPAR